MAKPKMNLKTPLAPLSWVNVRGTGKLKMDKEPDSTDANDFNYTATVTLTPAQAEPLKKKLDEFWRKNKPKGVGKQKYDILKEETKFVIDDAGEKLKDADDEPIKEKTGMWTITAKTMTVWPDGKPNVIKLLGSNSKLLQDGHDLEAGCGEGTMGIIHGSIGINGYSNNEGLQFYLNGVQIKDSTYTEYSGGSDIDADELEDDVVETEVQDGPENIPEV